ncbi:MAG: MarR family transcriptional regulator [Micrococcaceae bacterium]
MRRYTVRKLHLLVAKLDRSADVYLRREFGISYNRALVLLIILNNDPLTQHQLAVELGNSDPAVSNMLVELKKENLVTTEQDPNHGRRKNVRLTPKGRALAEEINAGTIDNFGVLLKAAKVDEKEFSSMLDRMLKMLDYERAEQLRKLAIELR